MASLSKASCKILLWGMNESLSGIHLKGLGTFQGLPLLLSGISVIKEDSGESETSGEFRDCQSRSSNKLCDTEQITEFLWAHFPPI